MNEKLSSLIDGELGASSVDSVYQDTVTNHDQLKTAVRYQLIGDVLRNEYSDVANHLYTVSLADRIQQRIADESTWNIHKSLKSTDEVQPSVDNVVRGRFTFRQSAFLGGFAVAAAISALAVFVLGPVWSEATVGKDHSIVVESTIATEPMTDDALTALLVEHGEFSGSAGINGLIAYAKFVSHDSQR
jgi:negative regulator of sigma E activity